MDEPMTTDHPQGLQANLSMAGDGQPSPAWPRASEGVEAKTWILGLGEFFRPQTLSGYNFETPWPRATKIRSDEGLEGALPTAQARGSNIP